MKDAREVKTVWKDVKSNAFNPHAMIVAVVSPEHKAYLEEEVKKRSAGVSPS